MTTQQIAAQLSVQKREGDEYSSDSHLFVDGITFRDGDTPGVLSISAHAPRWTEDGKCYTLAIITTPEEIQEITAALEIYPYPTMYVTAEVIIAFRYGLHSEHDVYTEDYDPEQDSAFLVELDAGQAQMIVSKTEEGGLSIRAHQSMEIDINPPYIFTLDMDRNIFQDVVDTYERKAS